MSIFALQMDPVSRTHERLMELSAGVARPNLLPTAPSLQTAPTRLTAMLQQGVARTIGVEEQVESANERVNRDAKLIAQGLGSSYQTELLLGLMGPPRLGPRRMLEQKSLQQADYLAAPDESQHAHVIEHKLRHGISARERRAAAVGSAAEAEVAAAAASSSGAPAPLIKERRRGSVVSPSPNLRRTSMLLSPSVRSSPGLTKVLPGRVCRLLQCYWGSGPQQPDQLWALRGWHQPP